MLKMRPCSTPRRAVGPGSARTRRLLSVCGRPAGGYRRRHRVSPSRELALSATNLCVARGRRGSRARFPSKVLQARAVPTDKGLACASPAAAAVIVPIFFFGLPRGQTRMFWIHRSQLRSTNFVFFKTNTLCAPRQIFSSLAPSKSRGCDWLRKKRISILPSFL